jgi:hypothetical protein
LTFNSEIQPVLDELCIHMLVLALHASNTASSAYLIQQPMPRLRETLYCECVHPCGAHTISLEALPYLPAGGLEELLDAIARCSVVLLPSFHSFW